MNAHLYENLIYAGKEERKQRLANLLTHTLSYKGKHPHSIFKSRHLDEESKKLEETIKLAHSLILALLTKDG